MDQGRKIGRLRDRLRREPGSIPLRLALIDALVERGARDEAVALLRELVRQHLASGSLRAAAAAGERLAALAPSDPLVEEVRAQLDEPVTNPWAILVAGDAGGAATGAAGARPDRERPGPGDDPLGLPVPFPGSFRETLGALAPDGSSIEPAVSLFGQLSPPALAELMRGMLTCHFVRGDVIVREGDPGHACYVVQRGEVRVLKREGARAEGRLIEVARLGEGALFGEFALLTDRRRHATVEATSEVQLSEISRSLLIEVVGAHPEVRPQLARFCRERLLATLLSTAPFFAPLPVERRAELLGRFEPRHAEIGAQIVRQGETAGGLYLIVLGTVEIRRQLDGGKVVPLAILSEGEYFGEMSLLTGQPAGASAVAIGSTELAVLPAPDFYALLAEHPVLWQAVRDEAERRRLETHQIITGVSGAV